MADHKRTELQKYYDEDKIVFGNHPSLIPRFISTGVSELDELMNGGLRVKASSLFVGQEGQGKTWTAQRAAKKTIEDGKKVVYIDVEKAYVPEWWKEVGVDISKLVVAQPDNAEEALDMVMGLLHDYDLIIVDSTAAFMPKDEEEKSAEYNPIGVQARFLSRFYRDITGGNRNSHVFIINQMRETVGVIYGNPAVIPGGKAQKFFVSSIMQCRRDSWIEPDKKRIGWNLKYEILGKHRGHSNPGDSVIVPVLFSGKIDEVGSIVNMALSLGIIAQEGAMYSIIDKETGEIVERIRGRARLTETMVENQELFLKLNEMVMSR